MPHITNDFYEKFTKNSTLGFFAKPLHAMKSAKNLQRNNFIKNLALTKKLP